jgi:tRNA wybutosine-synthesizing protein 1
MLEMNTCGAVLPDELIRKMEQKVAYRFVGANRHSAVKICRWTKNSLRGCGTCYKEQFYGIASHRCLQMSPAIPFCTERCQFCWRLGELRAPKWVGPVDEPAQILDDCIAARRTLLQGFGGNDAARGRLWEAERPTQVAISLDGEPLLYPKISELIDEIISRKMTAYLVTNGTLPDVLERMSEPTNLYVTLAGPNEHIFNETARPLISNAWEKLQRSLEMLGSFSCATIVRLTLAKGMNFAEPKQYGKIIKKSGARFAEIKAAMSVGAARERFAYEAMPLHPEIKAFAEQVAEASGYRIKSEHAPSRVVLLEK